MCVTKEAKENPLEPNENRRKTPRYPFIANAEVGVQGANTRLEARVSEISLNGCYLDMLNPLEVGTVVTVKIFADGDFFESAATVVYCHPNLGMGLSFRDINPHFVPTMQKWLLEAMRVWSKSNNKE